MLELINIHTMLALGIWKISTCVFLLVPVLTYIVTSVKCVLRMRDTSSDRKPPILPYWLPFVGNLIPFALNMPKFAADITDRFGFSVPVRVRVGPIKAYLVSDPTHFDTILRGARNLNSNLGIILTLRNIFALPDNVIPFYNADNSGIAATPIPGTNVPPHHRIGHLRHSAASKYLYGPHLRGMTERFVTNFGNQIAENREIGIQWVEYPDLTDFLQRQLFKAATGSLCGPYIFSLNPNFSDDFWEYISHLPTLAKGFPRWWNPGAWKARDRCLAAITKWHLHAWANVDHEKDDETTEWDPYFGTRLMRTRYTYARKMEAMTDEARAAEDLAMIFAANANAVPSAIYFIIEFVRDPKLLERVRSEIALARLPTPPNTPPIFDVVKLCEGALLQSVFAETLRMRVAVALMRSPEKHDFKLDNWVFPKGDLIFLSSRTAAYNKDLWNEGTEEDPHPLDEFWADRFIIYPDDPKSGPLKNPISSRKTATTHISLSQPGEPEVLAIDAPSHSTEFRVKDMTKPRFSVEGLAGGWIPFGGGVRMCPGRFFAKNEMMASFAMVCTNYDIDLLVPNGWKPEPDMRFFAVGALPPKGKIPFRIRRRNVE